MLNLPIAMLKAILSLIIIFQELTLVITAPQPGETLQGQVEIQGRTNLAEFTSAELSFTFAETASNPGATWFTIQTFTQPQAGPLLTVWDTTPLTDGNYTLRLRVFLQDGSFQEVFVPDLQIRNYTPDPTATPTMPSATPTPPPTATPLPSFNFGATQPPHSINPTITPAPSFNTPTPLPTNPATLASETILVTFGKSALLIALIFMLAALLLRVRKNA